MNLFSRKKGTDENQLQTQDAPASQSLVDLAAEHWRFHQALTRALSEMDPMDTERLENQYNWYHRKVTQALEESGLWTVDLTDQIYDVGMAVTPLNLDDFREGTDAVYRVAQMVEPIVMERGMVRKTGTVMLREELEIRDGMEDEAE